MIVLRRPAQADVDGLARIALAAYRASFADILPPEAMALRSVAGFAARFSAALDRMRLAELEGIAGFTMVTDGHLDMLFVAPDRQGSGVGRALLRAAQEEDGARSLECFADNISARGFYERAGWSLERAYARPFDGAERKFVIYRAPGIENGLGGQQREGNR